MRMAVGDFDFMEIYSEHPLMSLLLFWVSSLLIVMVLINIFIAIIMSAYDAVLSQNPDAADASSFGSMVMLQITRLIKGATGIDDDDERYAETDVHVLQNTMDRIEDEAYWDIFEGYFDLPSSDDEPEEDEAEEEAEEVDPDLQSLARDVAAIKKSQHEQAKQMGDVVSQLNELKELLRAVLK
jgi:peptidoglycan hydrolase CwlO-like protein